jgi:WS/DGAT/MGAT family acyltransferase
MPAYERLSALDASFLDLEDRRTHMHVAAVLIFDAAPLRRPEGGLDIDRLRRAAEARLFAFPRYRQRLARIPIEEHPVWVEDPDFNIHYHVRHSALPPPGSERQLKRFTGRVLSQSLDRGKPLWELWVVEGLEGGRFALVVKVHHCMVDGISGVDLLRALLRLAPDGRLEDPPGWWPRRAPSGAEILAGEVVRRAAEPFLLARSALRALRHPERALERLREEAGAVLEVLGAGLRRASETPLNPPRIGPHRRFDWIRLDLERVKEVKRHAGGTVNDVVLATVAGAVGRFLRGRGVPDLDRLEFRAVVPVNVRRDDERGQLGNRVAQILAPLPIGERDPLARLARVIETTRRLKQSRQARGTELLEELGDWTSTALLSAAMRLAGRVRTYNLVVTNVPGPPLPLYLLEAPLLEIYPAVPLFTNQALGIALFSYHEGLHFGLNSDWDRLPDLHDFADDLGLEFEELRKAVTG